MASAAPPASLPQVVMDPAAFQLSPACQAELKATRMKKRVHELLAKALAAKQEG